MIKQLLNSVIAKYRELSVASRSIVNCSCLCCVFYFRGMGRHPLIWPKQKSNTECDGYGPDFLVLKIAQNI